MKRISVRTFAMFACGVLLSQFSLAQSAPAQLSLAQTRAARKSAPAAQPVAERQWYSVNIVRVKPDMVADWQEFQRNEAIPALKKGGVKERLAWQTAVFGESYEFVFVTPIENFAQFDGESPIVRALGQEGARAYGAKARRMIAGSHTYAIQSRPDLSYEGKMTGPPKLAVVASVRVASGRNAALESFIKNEILPIMKRAAVPAYLVAQTVLGGDTDEYVTLTFYDSFADIGKGSPMMRVLGRQGYDRLLQRTAGIVESVERSVVRYNLDLSFGPTGPAASN